MRTTWAEINLDALGQNLRALRSRVGLSRAVIAMVKANAYGHGLVRVSKELERLGVEFLGVAIPEEGIELRESGVTVPIIVMGGILGSQIPDCLRHRLDITLISPELATETDRVASLIDLRARVHVKIDTGMERLGIRSNASDEALSRIAGFRHLEVVGICTHFATAAGREKSFTHQQLERFNDAILRAQGYGLTPPLVHMANSAAILDLPDSFGTAVRPGISLFGYYPSRETDRGIPLRPVLSLKSTVVLVKEIPPGTGISYGLTYVSTTSTRIATLPIGYADGLRRSLGNKTTALIKGNRYPVVGTICMDSCMVDVGMDATIQTGDVATIIGTESGLSIDAWDLADLSGTIPYEILTGVSARVPRIFTQSSSWN